MELLKSRIQTAGLRNHTYKCVWGGLNVSLHTIDFVGMCVCVFVMFLT